MWAVDERFQGMPGSERTFRVDTVALAVGLTPMAELAWLAGCRMRYVPELGGHVPAHDGRMATSVPGVFVAGDVSGVEEASSAMEEGRLAGVWAAAAAGKAADESGRRRRRSRTRPPSTACAAARTAPTCGAASRRWPTARPRRRSQVLGGGGV